MPIHSIAGGATRWAEPANLFRRAQKSIMKMEQPYSPARILDSPTELERPVDSDGSH